MDNINLRLVSFNGGTPTLIRQSNHPNNEYELVAARQGYGDNDTIQNVPLALRIYGHTVTADNVYPCGNNQMLVWYAWFFEDGEREDPDGPTIADVVRE